MKITPLYRHPLLPEETGNGTLLTHNNSWHDYRVAGCKVSRFVPFPTLIFILELQPGSSLDRPNDASLLHSVRCLCFPVANDFSSKAFFGSIHPSYGGSSFLPCYIWISECWCSARVEFVCSRELSQPPNSCSFNRLSNLMWFWPCIVVNMWK